MAGHRNDSAVTIKLPADLRQEKEAGAHANVAKI